MAKQFVADFETTTNPTDCRVWGWGVCPVSKNVTTNDVKIGGDIDSFFQHISEHDSLIYFHNLGFDGVFILDKLLKSGYRHVKDEPRKGEFDSLISHDGKFYSISVKWKNGGRTEFRDSLKKFPGMSVSKVAKSFHLEETKLEIDYSANRPVGHVITDSEKEYIAADVIIIAKALAVQLEQGMTRLTVGSDSLAEFKKLFGRKAFRTAFPVLAQSMDEDIRRAYRGGWTYCDPRTQGVKQGSGSVYDVNSLYPSVMRRELLPYGVPEWFAGFPVHDPDYPLWIASFTFTADLKSEHLPCIQIKGSTIFQASEYVTTIDDPVTLSMTNVDWELWNKHYDIDVLSCNGGWKFRGSTGFFDEYIDKWMSVKAESTGGMREIAKLHLNSLYGKFATNPNVTGKFPTLRNGIVHLAIGPEETRDPVYTAMGAFITSYARRVTISAAQMNYDRFAYADTDSLHLLGTEPPLGVHVHDSELGAWAHEYSFTESLFWRSKAYAERDTSGKMHVHIAGLPRPVADKVGFDDFRNGKVFRGKLLPKRVPGGIVLVEGNFTLK